MTKNKHDRRIVLSPEQRREIAELRESFGFTPSQARYQVLTSEQEREGGDRVHYLYRILLPDGRGYIGVSVDPKLRLSAHSSPSTRTLIGEAIRRYGRNACRLEILCAGHREYMYDLERRAVMAFKTRHPAGYNLDAGGVVPEHLPESIAKNVESNERTALRKRAEFRENTSVTLAALINFRRLKQVGPLHSQVGADLTLCLREAVAQRERTIPRVPPRPFDGRCETCPEIVGADQLTLDGNSTHGFYWVCDTCRTFASWSLKRRTVNE